MSEIPQKDSTPFYLRSPYGISKGAGFELTRNYREAYRMFCCNGNFFNHESPRHGYEFASRQITSTMARLKHGLANELAMGSLDAQHEWGRAEDYV